MSNLEIIRSYLDAIEANVSANEISRFFTADAIQEEFPNQLVPKGAKRELGDILDTWERGQKVMQSQTYEILHSVSQGDEIALEIQWTGTLAIGIGSLATGSKMKARFGVFIRLADGKIAHQRNYDCFDPF